MEESKSVLDGVEIKDNAFPLNKNVKATWIGEGQRLEIVGHCPTCGAPIYGRKQIAVEEVIDIRLSCKCAAIAAMPKTTIHDLKLEK